MVTVALVAGPFVMQAIPAMVFLVALGTINPTVRQARSFPFESWLRFLSPPLSAVLVVGIYRLTARGRDDGISDELGAGVRLVGIAHALALALLFVTALQGDLIGARFFEPVKTYSYFAVEALVALVAARHLVEQGWPRVATLAKVLAALAVAYGGVTTVLMSDVISARIAYNFSLPLTVVVWTMKLAVLGALLRALAKMHAAPRAAPERGDDGRTSAGVSRRRGRRRRKGRGGSEAT
jgi:hypothetical protein